MARLENGFYPKKNPWTKVQLSGKKRKINCSSANAIASVEEEIESLYQEQKNELQRIAELTRDEAKELLLDEVRNEIEHEQAQIIRNADAKMRDESEKRAREIISTAIQRYAADHVTESTVTVVTLPNEEMKGRIIGRKAETFAHWRP